MALLYPLFSFVIRVFFDFDLQMLFTSASASALLNGIWRSNLCICLAWIGLLVRIY